MPGRPRRRPHRIELALVGLIQADQQRAAEVLDLEDGSGKKGRKERPCGLGKLTVLTLARVA
jgi:hypothetical protein